MDDTKLFTMEDVKYAVRQTFNLVSLQMNIDVNHLVEDILLCRLAGKPFQPEMYPEIVVDGSMVKEDNNNKSKEE